MCLSLSGVIVLLFLLTAICASSVDDLSTTQVDGNEDDLSSDVTDNLEAVSLTGTANVDNGQRPSVELPSQSFEYTNEITLAREYGKTRSVGKEV